MAYVIDGNLYLQDGSNLPIQLTYNGEDQEPLISDDGKKIVFFRGKSADHVYVINADGSQEQLLITNSLLNERGLRYDEASEIRTFRSLAFVPGTHILLFNAYQIDPHDLELKYKNHVYAIGLFLVDIDSGKIRQLLAPGLGGSFKISPDGNLLSVITSGHIDIFGIDGQVIRRNLVTYTPSKPIELFPVFYWLPDSTGLIVSLLVESQYDIGDMPTYAIWRYPLDGNMAIQIPLSVLKHLTLPASALIMSSLFLSIYNWRTFFLIYSSEDYVEMAKAKGLPSRDIERRYILRPTLPTIITNFALLLIGLWTGAIITETVFLWPGLGRTLFRAIGLYDIPVIVGSTIIYAYLLAITVFLLDFFYALVDPRVKIGGGGA